MGKLFGTVPHSMRTLLIVMTLAEWDEIAKALQEMPNISNVGALSIFMFFVFYVLVAGFTFVALITAILCESLQSAQNDDASFRLEAMEDERRRFKSQLIKHLEKIDTSPEDNYLKRDSVDRVVFKNDFLHAEARYHWHRMQQE